MSTAAALTILDIIDELHREAARQIALSQQVEYKRTDRGEAICKERSEACLAAARHLMEAM